MVKGDVLEASRHGSGDVGSWKLIKELRFFIIRLGASDFVIFVIALYLHKYVFLNLSFCLMSINLL